MKEPISKNTVRFLLEKREKLEKIISSLSRNSASYWDYDAGETKRSKDLLDFVMVHDLTMRDVKKYLDVI